MKTYTGNQRNTCAQHSRKSVGRLLLNSACNPPDMTGVAALVSWPVCWNLNGQNTAFQVSCSSWTTDGRFLHLSEPPMLFRRSLVATPSAIPQTVTTLKFSYKMFALHAAFVAVMHHASYCKTWQPNLFQYSRATEGPQSWYFTGCEVPEDNKIEYVCLRRHKKTWQKNLHTLVSM